VQGEGVNGERRLKTKIVNFLLHRVGQRDDPIADIRAGFVAEVTRTLAAFSLKLDTGPEVFSGPAWRSDTRREGPLPPGLFEVVRFKDPDLAR
jgi:hypothetical protein